MNKWAALTGHVLLERYGMTELGMVLTNSYRGARHPGFVGMPFPSVRARLVDEEGNGTILLEASYHGVQGRNVDAGVTDEDTTQGLLEIKGRCGGVRSGAGGLHRRVALHHDRVGACSLAWTHTCTRLANGDAC